MEITLYEHKTEKVHTTIVAILEYGRLTISGIDKYQPTIQVPEKSEYVYEILLDSQSTKDVITLIMSDHTSINDNIDITDFSEESILNTIKDKFAAENADIKFQTFCLEHGIETYSSSFFED